jgi:hypothetical protein
MKPLGGMVPAESADVIDDRRITPDRRAAPRRRILRGGLTGWQNGDSSECIVHNLSETGAHLQIRGPVPRTFNLVIDGDGVSRSCCVVWAMQTVLVLNLKGILLSRGCCPHSKDTPTSVEYWQNERPPWTAIPLSKWPRRGKHSRDAPKGIFVRRDERPIKFHPLAQ